MTTQPILYHLEVETLGYAIRQLLRHTSLRSSRSLRDTIVTFLTDVGERGRPGQRLFCQEPNPLKGDGLV
jgi:hypothetical protein